MRRLNQKRIRSKVTNTMYVFCRGAGAALLLATALAIFPAISRGDTVLLKNGDHLTGTVTQLAGGKLTVTTSYAGALTITWDEVSSVKLDKPLLLPLEDKVDGKKLEIVGIERTPDGFSVTTSAGLQPVPAASLTALRTAAAQQAYEAALHPNWAHGWAGSANVSFAFSSGNSETTAVGTGVNFARPTRTDKTSLYYNTIYSHDGILNATTAEATNSGARYDHNLGRKVFSFATLDFQANALQNLNLREVAGGGIGFHAINVPREQLDFFAGAVYTHESYSASTTSTTTTTTSGNTTTTVTVTTPVPAETNTFGALDFGEQYTRKLGKASAFTEQAYIFPDLSDTSQFRFTLNTTLSTKISSFLSWQTTLSDIYVTNPPMGTQDNDLQMTTGLGISFTRK